MRAVYRENPAYPDNPFAETLPVQMEGDELIKSLERKELVSEKVRDLPTQQRLSYAAKAMEVFLPLGYTHLIYSLIYQGILSSYANKNSVDAVRQMVRIKEAQDKGLAPATQTFMTQAASASVLGVPGIGKSTTIMRILDTLPQVIEHARYKGRAFFCKQITYLNVQTPNDCSVKGCCIEILAAIDAALGTDYAPKGQTGRGQTVDAMIAKLSQLCLTHHVGIIIVDEIQNIVSMNQKGGYDSKLIRFFVQLMNDTGVAVLLVGTPEVGAFFDRHPHLARRTRGLRIMPLEYGTTFEKLLDMLWAEQVVKIYEPLNGNLKQVLYEVSGGVPALLAQVLYYAQQYAITSGKERLNEEVIKETAIMYQLRKPSAASQGTAASDFKLLGDNHEGVKEIQYANKGRPKAFREEDDILLIYDRCNGVQELLKQFKRRNWIYGVEA